MPVDAEKYARARSALEQYSAEPDKWRAKLGEDEYGVRVDALLRLTEEYESENATQLNVPKTDIGPSGLPARPWKKPGVHGPADVATQYRDQYIEGGADPEFVGAWNSALPLTDIAETPYHTGSKSLSNHVALYAPPKRETQRALGPADTFGALYEEPSVEQVRDLLRRQYPEGQAPAWVETIDEGDEAYARAADFLYQRAYQKAEREDKPIYRVQFEDPVGNVPLLGMPVSSVIKSLSAVRTGAGRGALMGAEKVALRAADAIDPTAQEEVSGLVDEEGRAGGTSGLVDDAAALSGYDEEAAAKHPMAAAAGELGGALMPGSLTMRLAGKLLKGANRVAAPLLNSAKPLANAVGRVATSAVTGSAGATLMGAAQDAADDIAEGRIPDVAGIGERSLARAGAGALLGGGISAASEVGGAAAKRVADRLAGRDYKALVERARGAGVEPGVLAPRMPPAVDDLAERGRANVSATGTPRPRTPMDQAVAEAAPPLAREGLRQQTTEEIQRAAAIRTYYDGAGSQPQELAELADTVLSEGKRLARTDVPGASPLPWHDPKVVTKQLPRLYNARVVDASKVQPGTARTLTEEEAEALGVGEAFWAQAAKSKDPQTQQLLQLIALNRQMAAAGLKVQPPKVVFKLTPVRGTAKELDDIQGAIDRDLVNARAGRSGKEVDEDPVLKEIQVAGYRNRQRFPAQPGVTPDEKYVIQGPDGTDIELRGFAALKRKHALEQSDRADLNVAAGLPENIPARRAAKVSETATPDEQAAIVAEQLPHLKQNQWTTLANSLRSAGKPGRDAAEEAQRSLIGGSPQLRLLEALNAAEGLNAALAPAPGAIVSGGGALRSTGLPVASLLMRLFPVFDALSANAARIPRPGPYQAKPFGGGNLALRNRQLRAPVVSWPILEDD